MTPSAEPLQALPARFALPLLGDTLAFVANPGGFLARRARALGPVFEVHLFGRPTACFVGADAFELLLDDANVVRAGANPPHVVEIFDAQAVPFLDGAAHRRRKRLLMHAFRDEALALYLPTIESIVARYVDRWATLGRFAWVLELDALGFAVAGALFVAADPAVDDPSIARAFATTAAGLLSLPIRLPFTAFGKALRARAWLLGRIDRALDAQAQAGARQDTVIAQLVAARDGDDRLTRDELRVETFHFFGAYAAVIGGLSFLASALGRFPDVAARAGDEVAREAPSGPVDLATLRRLTYLDAVTREVRRATPVLPLTFFGTVARDLSFRGIRIPKGHRAVGCIGATLLDEDVFADAARFDPDRWQRPDERQTRAWVPHGGGAHASGHRCAGERLADVMMKLVAVHLLRGCSFALAPDQDFAPTKNKLFATPAGGLQVSAFARGRAAR